MSSKFILNYQSDAKPEPKSNKAPAINEQNNIVEKPQPVDNEKEKLYRKIKKIYDRLVKNQISVFSRNNSIFEILIRNEEEMALISNFRISQYNQKLKTVKKFYQKVT
jgi:hypothetical protein